MVTVDFADRLTFGPGDGLTVVDEVPGGLGVASVPTGTGNLVSRALSLVGATADVRLVKRIPAGAGLGGGSADAGAVLRWAGGWDPVGAATLGADVPFCAVGGRARVTGIGEVLVVLPFEERRLLLLLPPVQVETAAVFAMWDLLEEGKATGSRTGDGGNDLEAAALAVAPELGPWREAFGNLTGLRPRLAGSGSTWWVEGDPQSLGVPVEALVVGGRRAPLVATRTVPAGWRAPS